MNKNTLEKEINYYLDRISNYFTQNNTKILKKKLSQIINSISKNSIIAPRSNIIVPLLYQLTINDPNSNVGNILIKILKKELSEKKDENITSQIIDIIINISDNDINFINDLYQIMEKRGTNRITICFVKEKPLENNHKNLLIGSYEIGRFLIDDVDHKYYDLFNIENLILENLKRLGLIEIDRENYLVKDEDQIRKTFENHKNEYDDDLKEIGLKLIVEPGIITITELGKIVMRECLIYGEA